MPTALIGDSLRLGQVLINLGNNAVKFTDKGEIVVGIEKLGEDADSIELHFWVKDSGIGMTPEQCGKMFQSFSQADASTTRKFGGTGLGLVICKNLVELMGGGIWLDSEVGKGSTFHFNARFGLDATPMPRRMFRADELLGVRVLVVDDNASAREILSSMARSFGMEVDAANDGVQAVAMISGAGEKELPYDLVLMDWKMPVMDGVETIQRLQEQRLTRTPAVIMVTAYGRDDVFEAAEARGVALKTVLTKPLTSSSLLEAIGEILDKGIPPPVETHASEKANTYGDAVARLNGARVLLVEDNEMNQELAMELLNRAGMTVVLANNGQEALDNPRAGRPLRRCADGLPDAGNGWLHGDARDPKEPSICEDADHCYDRQCHGWRQGQGDRSRHEQPHRQAAQCERYVQHHGAVDQAGERVGPCARSWLRTGRRNGGAAAAARHRHQGRHGNLDGQPDALHTHAAQLPR